MIQDKLGFFCGIDYDDNDTLFENNLYEGTIL